MDEIEKLEYINALKGFMELAALNAKAVRTYYQALIAAEFAPAEALKIVMRHGYMPPSPGRNNPEE